MKIIDVFYTIQQNQKVLGWEFELKLKIDRDQLKWIAFVANFDVQHSNGATENFGFWPKTAP